MWRASNKVENDIFLSFGVLFSFTLEMEKRFGRERLTRNQIRIGDWFQTIKRFTLMCLSKSYL